MTDSSAKPLAPIKGVPVPHSIGSSAFAALDAEFVWMHYNVPLIWEYRIENPGEPVRYGVAKWSDVEVNDQGLPDYTKVRYHLYEYSADVFETMRDDLLAKNGLIRPWFERAPTKYVVDVCEHQDFKILDVRSVQWDEIDEDDKPQPDARLRWSGNDGE